MKKGQKGQEESEAYIVYARRTPLGRFNGKLASVRADDLLACLFEDVKEWAPFAMNLVDDVVVGCANQAGEDNRNLARMALILGGFPFEVPGTTINRLCGSSLDALLDAWSRIHLGLADCILVGGAESMTRAPYVLSKANTPYGRGQELFDTSLGWRFPNPRMKALFPLYSMGETAEYVARQCRISRERQDRFSLDSHQKAVAAQKAGAFDDEILPVSIKLKKGEFVTVREDEGPRKDTSLEKLARLRPIFCLGEGEEEAGTRTGTVTAGNSSGLNDGASALLIVSRTFLEDHRLTPLVRLTGGGVRGIHPNTMGLGPIEATKSLCRRFSKKVSDFDVIELNEAFAAQSLACLDELGWDPKRVNVNGGAIALGHPLGCSGARITATLIHIMQKKPSYKQGLATMCIGVGQGVAVSVENCR